MDAAETRAWIFLSVPEEPAPVAEVLARADGINHAIPTDEQLRTSLRWLQKQGLVCKEGRQYSLTESGVALRRRQRSSMFFKLWDDVAEEFRRGDANHLTRRCS